MLLGRDLRLAVGLAMSYVAGCMGLPLVSDELLTFAVGALDLFAFAVVARDAVTRLDSLGMHLAVGTHLGGTGRAEALRLGLTVFSSWEGWHSAHGILEGILHILLHPSHVVVHGTHLLADTVLKVGHQRHGLKRVDGHTIFLGVGELFLVLKLRLFSELGLWLLSLLTLSIGALNDFALSVLADGLLA